MFANMFYLAGQKEFDAVLDNIGERRRRQQVCLLFEWFLNTNLRMHLLWQ